MNIIFLTASRIRDIKSRGIYSDLLRKFRDEGHNVYIVSPNERRFNIPTGLNHVSGVHILGVRTLNIQKTNVIEKGISTLLLEKKFKQAIKKNFDGVEFDLILYSTPPVIWANVVRYLKRKNPRAISYLLLKDIFPQNAVDIGLFSKKSFLFRYFRRIEVSLYKLTDFFGCMSPANVDFLLRNNEFINPQTVEIAPNSIELIDKKREVTFEHRSEIRQKYNLPIDKPIFIYGGNLGKPQGISFLIECLNANADRNDCHFVVVGNGTEYSKLEAWYKVKLPLSVSLFSYLPKEDYDMLVQSCDIGLIFLDHRFTIPNYPSRLLSYLECKMPVIAATDVNTDIGRIAEDNGYGYWCESVDVKGFIECVDKYIEEPTSVKIMGARGYQFLLNNYLVEHTYKKVIAHL